MKWVRVALTRIAGIFSEGKRKELSQELESHLQMQTEQNLRTGMSPEEARREAVLRLGSVESAQEAYADQESLPLVETFLQDVRFALRQLRRNPGFTVTAILMLSLGMAASVAIFSFVEATLIRPLPYRDPDRLVDVNESVPAFPRSNLSYDDYIDMKRMNQVFSSMEMYGGRGFMLSAASGPELVTGSRVSAGFFRTLGVAPVIGRDFNDGEDQPNTPVTVMLSYAAWQQRYGGRRDVLGQTITLSGIPSTVIGVLPRDFHFAPRGDAEFWQVFRQSSECDHRRSCHGLYGVARLKDGVTVETAKANMRAIAERLEREYPDSNRGQGSSVMPLYEAIVGNVRPILLVLLSGAGLLLLIACVNVSSLLLVRFENRKREIAVRGALGATNGRLMRQLVTESCVLVLAGSVFGLGLAALSMAALLKLISKDMLFSMPYLRGLGMNLHVLEFAGAVAALAVILFSLAPVLRLPSSEIREGLNEAGRSSTGFLWRRLGSSLVVVELALAMVLLVGAGLLGKSFYRLLHVDLNFEPEHLATVGVNVPPLRYSKPEQQAEIGREVVRSVQSLPGVESVGIVSLPPVSGNGNTDWIRFVGKPYNGEHNEVNERDVSADYFKTLQASLIRGRFFTDADDLTKPKVAIISQTLARKYFSNEDPIGQKIGDTTLTPGSLKEIVGVVADIRESTLDTDSLPTAYYPINQSPDNGFVVIARTSQPEQTVLTSISSAVHQLDPQIGTIGETTMKRRISESSTAYLHRSSAWLVGGFATLALLLGAIGLYGVIAYSVSQRTREIGVRMALGAQKSSVYQLILGEAGKLTTMGIVAGIVCSIGAATLIRKLLFGVSSWDIGNLGIVVLVLGSSALFASFLPARRAASVNPVEALRSE